MEIATLILSSFVAIWAIINSIISFRQSLKIESIKNQLDKSAHQYNVQFDYEFDCYKRLSRLLGETIKANSLLFPCGSYSEPETEPERNMFYLKIYKESLDAYNTFDMALCIGTYRGAGLSFGYAFMVDKEFPQNR